MDVKDVPTDGTMLTGFGNNGRSAVSGRLSNHDSESSGPAGEDIGKDVSTDSIQQLRLAPST